LQPWEPLRADEFFTLPAVEQRLAVMEQQMANGSALHLLLRGRLTGAMLGECNFTNIVRGPFQACFLGFSIGSRYEGRGLMHEALSAAIDHVFSQYRLHRIMANHRPENLRSGKLLAKLGFEREGLARAYLKINGTWADHVLTSRINPRD
jgi:ribosomal-protein-alanine N-acetyltransferase